MNDRIVPKQTGTSTTRRQTRKTDAPDPLPGGPCERAPGEDACCAFWNRSSEPNPVMRWAATVVGVADVDCGRVMEDCEFARPRLSVAKGVQHTW
jgi:hypothetical protein